MTAGYAAKGTQLNWNSQPIKETTSIKGPGEKANQIDLTSHDSVDDFKEFIAGLRDGGEISFEMHFVPSDTNGQIAMHTDFGAGTTRAWTIVAPGGIVTISGNGHVNAWTPDFPDDGPASISGSIKVTGKPTLTIA